MHTEHGRRHHEQHARGHQRRQRREAQRRPQDRGPQTRGLPLALRALQQRAAVAQPHERARLTERPQQAEQAGREHGQHTALHAVPELAEQRGQHGERADHRGEDDQHRADPDRAEHLVAGEQHSRHRDQHRAARDQHGPARRGGRAAERVVRPAVASFLTLALQVEERVVHAHGHAHQQHHRVGGVGGVEEVARGGSDAERAEHAGERQQHGHARRDERTEREQQHQERDRHRELLGVREVPVDRLVQLVLRTGVAELRDRERGRRSLQNFHNVQYRLNSRIRGVRGAADRELHERRVAVRRKLSLASLGEGRAHVPHRWQRLELRHHAVHGAPEGRLAHLMRAALDEHALAGVVVEARLTEDLLGSRGLAGRRLAVRQLHRAQDIAEHHRDRHEREPAERRRLPVCGAPAAGALREVGPHLVPPFRVESMPEQDRPRAVARQWRALASLPRG